MRFSPWNAHAPYWASSETVSNAAADFPYSRRTLRRVRWSRCLRRRSTVALLLGLRVRIPPGVWMSVYCECCVLSGRGLCDGPITHPEESYRVWSVVFLNVTEEPRRRSSHTGGLSSRYKKKGPPYVQLLPTYWLVSLFLDGI
jgi:hypothetical protein